MTTPLEREILTHYATRPGPYLDGSENWRPVHCEIVSEFVKCGLLVQTEGGIHANHEALEVYMAALADVPLPVRAWIIPASREVEA